MGLDMYLRGDKYLWKNYDNPKLDLIEDGFRVVHRELEIGYWRKHPNLHGFIVNTFADGMDRCQRIGLGVDELHRIIGAVKSKSLPYTTGFFFGESDGTEDEKTIRILESAIAWLETDEPGVSRTVFYESSW